VGASAVANFVSPPSAALFQAPAGDADRALVEALRAGETRAGEALFAAYAPYVRKVVTRVLGPDAETLDLVQDVFVVALESLHAAQSSHAREADVVRAHEKHHSRAALPKRRHRHHRHTAHKAATSPAQASTPQPTWQALARAGKFSAAYALGRDVQLDTLSVSDALLLGDTARLSGDTTAALHIYEKVRQRHAGSNAAAAAAFASGQLQFDQRSAFTDAARWFALYLHERSTGPLAREASGRLLEALERSGQHGAAKRAATAYLRAYPTGPHATFARGLSPAE
jgi:DNA-directed RNA polymerase specialized sigma24 family protein